MTILTPERLAEIEARAKKATPGPYTARQALSPVDGAYDWAIAAQIDGRPQVILEAFGRSDWTVYIPAEHNASLHAALDPQTVLALLASHAALQAEVERLRHDVERHMQIAADLESELTTAREAGAREMRERCANVAREYKKPVRPKPTIEELEVILAQDTDPGIEITPDGEVRAAGTHLGHDIAAAISALPLTPADGAKDE